MSSGGCSPISDCDETPRALPRVTGSVLKPLFKRAFQGIIWLAHRGLGIEGVSLLLLVTPSSFVVPILRRYGAVIGEGVEMLAPLIIHNADPDYHNLVVGNDCYFGRMVLLDLKDRIEVGDRVTISMRATLVTHIDVGSSKVKKFIPPQQDRIQIEDDAYLGAGVSVFHGVRIGQAAVVGAGSIVRHDVAPGCMVAGNPARETKRFE
jgi:acetyltransferase-like isoleucine patch superfamily enzyme